jgi:hypothetical protein
MKYRILLLITLVSILILPPGRAAQADEGGSAELNLLASNGVGVVFELKVPGYVVEEIKDGINPISELRVDGSMSTSEAGKPQLPMMSALIGIPANASVELNVLDDQTRQLDQQLNLLAVPVPAASPDGLSMDAGESVSGSRDATNDQWYPANSVRVTGEGWMRNQRVARIEFFPFQYRPSDGSLVWHASLRLQVRFIQDPSVDFGNLAAPTGTTASIQNPFEAALRLNLANYEVAREFRSRIPSEEIQTFAQNDWIQEGEPRYRIEVDQDGLYQLTYAALQTAGLDVAHIDPTLLHLSSQGQDVAIYVENEDGNEHAFSPSETIYFYGQKFSGGHLAQEYSGEAANYLTYLSQLPDGTINSWHPQFSALMLEKYTDTNVYWLSLLTAPGTRMQVVDVTPHDTAQIPSSYTSTVRAEQSRYWFTYSFTSEETWYWDELRNTTPRAYQSSLTALASGTYSATIRGEMIARASNIYFTPDHHTRMWINRQATPFSDEYWDGLSRLHFEEQVPQTRLLEGTNTITVTMLTDAYPGQGTVGDWIDFDWFEIEYARRFQAQNDQIAFTRNEADTPWQYEIVGFTSPGVTVLDTTAPLAPQWLVNQRFSGGILAYEARHAASASYLAVGTNSLRNPKSISYYQPPDLRSSSNRYDYIFITHSNFTSAAQTLSNFWTTQGLSTRVVDINDVYNEFNYGIFHSIAIKNFLAYTFAHWAEPPTYVLLIGDGHWNFKSYPRYNAPPIYMPPHLAWVDPIQGEVDSSNQLASVVGVDPIPDVLIGRMPVNTISEANAAVAKIISYEGSLLQGWENNVTFVADNVPDPAGNFVESSERMISDYIEPGYEVRRIYENNYACPGAGCAQVNQAIISTINITGTLLLNYAGHGAINRWSQESIFTNNDISSLNNPTQLPVIVSMTCLDGYWLHPGLSPTPAPSITEELLRTPNKGAIAAFSPTGLGVATGHDELWHGFYDATFRDGNWRLGEVALAAKLRLYATGGNLDLVHTYTIIGDPALKIKTPYQFSMEALPDGQQHLPGSIVERILRITNSGLVPDTFSVTRGSSQWVVTVPNSVGPISPGASVDVPVRIYTPISAPNGASDSVVITVTSQGDRGKQATTTLVTTVNISFTWRLVRLPLIVK